MLWALFINRRKLKISTKLCAVHWVSKFGDQYIVGTRMLGDFPSVCAYIYTDA